MFNMFTTPLQKLITLSLFIIFFIPIALIATALDLHSNVAAISGVALAFILTCAVTSVLKKKFPKVYYPERYYREDDFDDDFDGIDKL